MPKKPRITVNIVLANLSFILACSFSSGKLVLMWRGCAFGLCKKQKKTKNKQKRFFKVFNIYHPRRTKLLMSAFFCLKNTDENERLT